MKKKLEGAAFYGLVAALQRLPPHRASTLGGWLAQHGGPWLFSLQRVAEENMKPLIPCLRERKQCLQAMWYHWGCVAAEYSHLAYFIDHPHLITVSGQEVVEELIRDQKPALVFSAHWGNFQMIPIVAARLGLPLVQFYRAPNHPGVAERFRTLIQPSVEKIITKGPVGTRQLLHAFAQGSHLFMLLDQYAQDGLMLPFLGRASATVLAPAALCRKFHCPLVPARAERTGPMQFHVTFYPPLAENKSDEARMMQVNDLMSSWITQRPEQWFWIHKRWKTPFNPMKPYP